MSIVVPGLIPSQLSTRYSVVAKAPLGAALMCDAFRSTLIIVCTDTSLVLLFGVRRDSVAFGELALRVFPAVTWLTVYRWLQIVTCRAATV